MRFYGTEITSSPLLGTAQYTSPQILKSTIAAGGAEIVTVSLRRENADGSGAGFWEILRETSCHILPITAGCHSVKEALTTAHMARDLFGTRLDQTGSDRPLRHIAAGCFRSCRSRTPPCPRRFSDFPYTTDDPIVGEKLIEAGCEVLIPWGSPIGSGQGLRNPDALRAMRACFPEALLIVDAGIGHPSDAMQAVEIGMDAVLMNTAVAMAGDAVTTARAMACAVKAGRLAYRAGPMERRDGRALDPRFGHSGIAVTGHFHLIPD